MRTLHPTLCCPECGLPYELIRSTRKTIEHDIPGVKVEEFQWPASGLLELLVCQHGKAESGPAVGLVPPGALGAEQRSQQLTDAARIEGDGA